MDGDVDEPGHLPGLLHAPFRGDDHEAGGPEALDLGPQVLEGGRQDE